MNPTHAACFNELKALCERYGLTIRVTYQGEAMFEFDKCIYSISSFDKNTSILNVDGYTTQLIPPPEAIEKDE